MLILSSYIPQDYGPILTSLFTNNWSVSPASFPDKKVRIVQSKVCIIYLPAYRINELVVSDDEPTWNSLDADGNKFKLPVLIYVLFIKIYLFIIYS